MENPREKCPQCGKKIKFLKKHIKRAHSSEGQTGKVPGNVQGILKDIPGTEKSKFLKEINLQGEFKNMEETVNPKKSKEEESKTYKCGSCGGTFKERIKRCPHCGVEFE